MIPNRRQANHKMPQHITLPMMNTVSILANTVMYRWRLGILESSTFAPAAPAASCLFMNYAKLVGSNPLFMAFCWHPRPNHHPPAAFEKNAKNVNNPGFEPPSPALLTHRSWPSSFPRSRDQMRLADGDKIRSERINHDNHPLNLLCHLMDFWEPMRLEKDQVQSSSY